MATAKDRITVNVGGRLFETTKTTLDACGFFKALLGDTGSALAGASDSKDPREPIYVDSDPDLFEDILFFMRRNVIRSKTKLDITRLTDLKTEAEFFAFDVLVKACEKAINSIAKTVKEKRDSEKVHAHAESAVISPGDNHTIFVPSAKSVVYIVSATLAGRCRMRRYAGYPEEDKDENGKTNDIPGCYLDTAEKKDTGDFQLLASFGEHSHPVCLAHVGLDNIHVSNKPVNYDFRQDLRICLTPDDDLEVTLGSGGSGEWHVIYWVGDADAIPQLMERPSKRRRLNANIAKENDDDDEEETSLFVMAAAMTMLAGASILGLL